MDKYKGYRNVNEGKSGLNLKKIGLALGVAAFGYLALLGYDNYQKEPISTTCTSSATVGEGESAIEAYARKRGLRFTSDQQIINASMAAESDHLRKSGTKNDPSYSLSNADLVKPGNTVIWTFYKNGTRGKQPGPCTTPDGRENRDR